MVQSFPVKGFTIGTLQIEIASLYSLVPEETYLL